MRILDFIFPNSCLGCRSVDIEKNYFFCSDCWKDLIYIQKPMCLICGIPFSFDLGERSLCQDCERIKPSFDMARSIFVYNSIIKRSILRLKHYDQTQYAKKFAELIASNFVYSDQKIDVIIPIPLHWTRLFYRQYNQAGLIGQHLSKALNIPIDYHSLIRTKKTKSQKDQSRKERFENLRNAFFVKNKSNIKGKNVLLVDDVMTTGRTFEEAAFALKQADVHGVFCIAIARSVPWLVGFEESITNV